MVCGLNPAGFLVMMGITNIAPVLYSEIEGENISSSPS